MTTHDRAKHFAEAVTYKPDTGFRVEQKGDCVFIQHWQVLPDCNTGRMDVQDGRKFYISPHMTDEEILRTFLLAARTFEEHEAYEWLRYNGERVLNPHPEGPRPDHTDPLPDPRQVPNASLLRGSVGHQ